MFGDNSSSYERILEGPHIFSMDVKRKHQLCIVIYKTLKKLNPSFIKEIFELRLSSSKAREKYKMNLNIPEKKARKTLNNMP